MKNRNRWILVLIWILCIALGAGFFFKVRDDRRKNAERTAQLKEQAEASEQIDAEKLVDEVHAMLAQEPEERTCTSISTEVR